jgi:hypothetical protein
MNSASTDNPLRDNPVFWLIWVLLGSAVLGGLVTLAIALRSADRQLPAMYHWEGERLERDFALARAAAAHGIEAGFTNDVAAGRCTVTLRRAPGDPPALTAHFVSATDAGLDRVLRLARVAPGEYGAPCEPLPAGRWRLVLEDPGQWSLRARTGASLDDIELRARDPDGAR